MAWALKGSILGPQGDAGTRGPKGDTGDQGVAGSKWWYTNSGAPGAGFGVDGDWCIDKASGDVYYKSGTTWSIALNVKGPTGNSGVQVVSGSPGSDPSVVYIVT